VYVSLADNITAIVKKFVEPTKYYGFYPYIVESFVGGRPNLRPIDATYDTPSLKSADRIPGFTGAEETFPIDTLVIVGFVGGNHARPFVAFTQATIPTAIVVTVNGVMSVKFAGSAVALVKNNALSNYLTALETYIAGIVANLATPAAIPALTTAFNAAAGPAKSAMPTQRLHAE
jgi:hypothetical protein